MLILSRMDNHKSWADAENDHRAVGDVAAALSGFRTYLGDGWCGWIDTAPLASQFFGRFQGRAAEGVRLWEMVEALSGVRGLKDVVNDLGGAKWNDFFAAVMALEFCSAARNAGCDVEFVERDGGKSPDARVRVVGRWMVVEFKALHDRDEMEDWVAFETLVRARLAAHQLATTSFDRKFTNMALDDPEAVVEGLASIASRNVRVYEALPRGTGHARLASSNVGECGYPVEQRDELLRIVSKMHSKKWRKQLEGAGAPTLLVVKSKMLFPTIEDPVIIGNCARRIATGLTPHLARLPMFGAVLVYEEPFQPPVFTVSVRADNRRVRMDSPRGCARFMVLTHNTVAADPLTEAELDRLAGSEPIW